MAQNAQVRIVLNPKYKAKAYEILETTGIDNLSQLFTLFLANYSDLLIQGLKAPQAIIPPVSSPSMSPMPAPIVSQAPSIPNPTIKPETQPQAAKKFQPMGGF